MYKYETGNMFVDCFEVESCLEPHVTSLSEVVAGLSQVLGGNRHNNNNII